MQCPKCGGQMSQTAGGSWRCWTCGNSQLRAAPPQPMNCPYCNVTAIPGDPGWYRCPECRWQIDEQSHEVYADLVAALEADPDRFFAEVEQRLAWLREQAPVWQ